MVLISFSTAKQEVKSGIKNMTIRALRKRPIKIGDTLHLYWKSRTKECEKLKEEFCVYEYKLSWDRIKLLKKREELAKLDGFQNWNEMEKWFNKAHKNLWGGNRFQIICWDYKTKEKLEDIIKLGIDYERADEMMSNLIKLVKREATKDA